MICGSGGSKSRLAKAAGAEPAGQMRDEKLHAVKNTRGSDHFWKLRCRKSARRCGAKHISKSKCTKHTSFGPLLLVEMSKKCTPLWREAHFEVKMYKTHQLRTTFGSWDVQKVHAVVARSTFPSQNVQSTPASDHFWKLRCRKSARRCGAKHISKSKCTKHTSFGPLLEVQMSLRVASGHYTTLYTPLHYSTLHYTTLHNTTTTTTEIHNYTPLHSTTLYKLQYTTPHYTTLHYSTLHYTTLYTPLHYTTLHYTIHSTHYSTLHYTTLHNTTTTTTELHNYTPLRSTTHRYTKLHYTTLHYTTLHYTRKIDR